MCCLRTIYPALYAVALLLPWALSCQDDRPTPRQRPVAPPAKDQNDDAEPGENKTGSGTDPNQPQTTNSGEQPDDTEPGTSGTSGTSSTASPADAIKLSVLKSELQNLASDEFAGRKSSEPGHEAAQEYLIKQFKAAGIEPGNKGEWLQSFTYSGNRGSGSTSNIVGLIPGADPDLKDQYVIIGAHLDHLGQSGTDIFNGADDNASGSIAVAQMAQAIKKSSTKIGRSLVIILFSAEELGLHGSRYYVDHPIYPLEDTTLMINLDMVGYSQGQLQALGAAAVIGLPERLETIASGYPQLEITTSADGGGRSDHAPFIAKGVPSVLFHTGAEHPHYHQPTDTADRIDYEGYLSITKLATELAFNVLNDQSYPTGFNLVPRSYLRTPVNELYDFETYFQIHGTGHQPEKGSFDNALLPGQPL